MYFNLQLPSSRFVQKTLILTAVIGSVFLMNVTPAWAAIGIVHHPIVSNTGYPSGITIGPDGNMWFADINSGKVGKITLNGIVTEYDIDSMQTVGIVSGPDGNLWVTEHSNDFITRVTPAGTYTKFALDPGTNPSEIIVGSNGNLWFTEEGTGRIGEITVNGIITHRTLNVPGMPTDIMVGPDGNVWFSDATNSTISKITPSGAIVDYSIPTPNYPAENYIASIATGSDGNVWFTENNGNKIGKLTIAGVVTEYDVPAGTQPQGITAGPDGNLWVAGWISDEIIKITTGGVMTHYTLPAGSNPRHLAVGPDNNIWFSEYEKIGVVTGLTIPVVPAAPVNNGNSPSNNPLVTAITMPTVTSDNIAAASSSRVPGFTISTVRANNDTTLMANTPGATVVTNNITAETKESPKGGAVIVPLAILAFVALTIASIVIRRNSSKSK